MITGQWGRPSQVLLDLVVEEDGSVRGVANPGRQNAQIRRGHFDAASRAVNLKGEYAQPSGTPLSFSITGRLDGRILRLKYQFGEDVAGLWDVPEFYKKLDAAAIQQAARTYLKGDNEVRVTLLPEKK